MATIDITKEPARWLRRNMKISSIENPGMASNSNTLGTTTSSALAATVKEEQNRSRQENMRRNSVPNEMRLSMKGPRPPRSAAPRDPKPRKTLLTNLSPTWLFAFGIRKMFRNYTSMGPTSHFVAQPRFLYRRSGQVRSRGHGLAEKEWAKCTPLDHQPGEPAGFLLRQPCRSRPDA